MAGDEVGVGGSRNQPPEKGGFRVGRYITQWVKYIPFAVKPKDTGYTTVGRLGFKTHSQTHTCMHTHTLKGTISALFRFEGVFVNSGSLL